MRCGAGGVALSQFFPRYSADEVWGFFDLVTSDSDVWDGATLTVADFVRVLKMPIAVFVGFVLQFSVMPFLGWSISLALGLPPELMLGMVLGLK